MSAPITTTSRRAHGCPHCGPVIGALQEDHSMVCLGVVRDWYRGEPLLVGGCGLRVYLCRAHGLRTRREGDPDTQCRCAAQAALAAPLAPGGAARPRAENVTALVEGRQGAASAA